MRIELERQLFVGVRIDNKLRDALDHCPGRDRVFFDGSDARYLTVVRATEDSYIGKVIDAGVSAGSMDDLKRNILSILTRLSSGRRDVVNSLYDHIITFRHKELRDAWRAIYRAEESIAKSKSAGASQAKSLLADARKAASRVPIGEQKASDKEVAGAFKSKSGLKAQLETEWENTARANYAKASELASKAAALAR